MKNIILYILMLVTGTICCSAESYTFDGARGIVFSWQTDDAIGIYTTSGTRIEHWATDVDPDGSTSSFSSYGWSLAANSTYYLYSPYNRDYYLNSNKITSLPISYQGQTQAKNDDLSHLAAYDYMIGRGKTTATEADFYLTHIGAVLRIDYQSPETKTYTRLTLKSDEQVFTESATMNLETLSTSPSTISSEASIELGNIRIDKGGNLTVNMMIAPADLSGKDISIMLTSTDGSKKNFNMSGCKIKAGHLYLININKGKAQEKDETTRSLSKGTLTAPTVTASDFDFDEESSISTDIVNTVWSRPEKDVSMYDIYGRKILGRQTKGLYIYKGKKIISK